MENQRSRYPEKIILTSSLLTALLLSSCTENKEPSVALNKQSLNSSITPSTPYSPTRLEFLTMKLNVSLINVREKERPACFSDMGVAKIHCIGFLGTESRNKEIKKLIREDFEKNAFQMGIYGQVELVLPD